MARRQQLVRAGLSTDDIRTELETGRWVRLGRHTIGVTVREPAGLARCWWAVWEAGPGAALDGVTSLQVAGLQNWRQPALHVSVPSKNAAHALPGVVLHRPRHLGPVITAGLPRTRPEKALVRAVQWASSDRQAATLLAMAVQQRLVSPARVLQEWLALRRRTRRLDPVVRDVCDGAHSLGELDFVGMCRRRGLPAPALQVRQDAPDGRVYLDAYWRELGVHVEIDGVQHRDGVAPVDDALRQNVVALRGSVTLRIPVLGLRLTPDRFLDQVAAALRAAGWRP